MIDIRNGLKHSNNLLIFNNNQSISTIDHDCPNCHFSESTFLNTPNYVDLIIKYG